MGAREGERGKRVNSQHIFSDVQKNEMKTSSIKMCEISLSLTHTLTSVPFHMISISMV